jgi:hypothetical protein
MREFDSLGTLIGGYLNEDWYMEYGDPWSAIERFVLWEPDYAPLIRSEVNAVISQSASDHDVEKVLDGFGLGYAATSAGWDTYGNWLLAVADRVEELLHKEPAA